MEDDVKPDTKVLSFFVVEMVNDLEERPRISIWSPNSLLICDSFNQGFNPYSIAG
jgi:hypothetical protein